MKGPPMRLMQVLSLLAPRQFLLPALLHTWSVPPSFHGTHAALAVLAARAMVRTMTEGSIVDLVSETEGVIVCRVAVLVRSVRGC